MTKLVLISGPCVIESRQLCLDIAGTMKGIAESLGFKYFFKASFDKANRTSEQSFRGPGLDEGLHILADVREQIGVPVLTDVHTVEQVKPVAEVVDMLQTPAFLCRQTDFVHACAQSGKPVNFKKGQFLSPYDMKNVIDKAKTAAAAVGLPTDVFFCCERGASFGYGNLVVDMRSLAIMSEFVPVLARAAAAVGVAGFFFETHPDPEHAKSDGPNMVPLKRMKELLEEIKAIDALVKSRSYLEDSINE